MQRTLDWRRYRRELAIKRVERWMLECGLWTGRQVTTEESHETCRKWARHRHSAKAVCSGPCCGNPRRHFKKLTLAERRFADSASLEVNELRLVIPHIGR